MKQGKKIQIKRKFNSDQRKKKEEWKYSNEQMTDEKWQWKIKHAQHLAILNVCLCVAKECHCILWIILSIFIVEMRFILPIVLLLCSLSLHHFICWCHVMRIKKAYTQNDDESNNNSVTSANKTKQKQYCIENMRPRELISTEKCHFGQLNVIIV